MNNKRRGMTFESEFAQLLSKHGFWARLDKGKAQTCDILASRNNISYLFECKTTCKNYFNMTRVEDNQSMSRLRFAECGNTEAYFVFLVNGEDIYLSKEPIKKPSDGISFDDFLKSIDIRGELRHES